MSAPDSLSSRLLRAATEAEYTALRAEAMAENDRLLIGEIEPMIAVASARALGQIEALIERRRAVIAAQVGVETDWETPPPAAWRQAAMERVVDASEPGSVVTAQLVFYGIEGESRATGRPPDELAIGDVIATAALAEVARTNYRTDFMRGWLHRNWASVEARARRIALLDQMARMEEQR